jgi:hypothetical protein
MYLSLTTIFTQVGYFWAKSVTIVKVFVIQTPWWCNTTFFTIVIITREPKVSVFVTDSHFWPSLIFSSKVGAKTLRVGVIALPENIRLEWQWLPLTNTLAYSSAVIITLVNIVIVISQGLCFLLS